MCHDFTTLQGTGSTVGIPLVSGAKVAARSCLVAGRNIDIPDRTASRSRPIARRPIKVPALSFFSQECFWDYNGFNRSRKSVAWRPCLHSSTTDLEGVIHESCRPDPLSPDFRFQLADGCRTRQTHAPRP